MHFVSPLIVWMCYSDAVEYMATTRFCLAPYGAGWGIRLSALMVTGCIPVIIQDQVLQFLEDILPYEKFSLRVPKSQIPNIVKLLRAVSDEEQARLRLGMAEYWPWFVWGKNAGGRAYEGVLQSLGQKQRAQKTLMW